MVMWGRRPVTAVIAEAKYRRPILTSLLIGVLFAPLGALIVTMSLSMYARVGMEPYLPIVLLELVVIAGLNVFFARRQAQLLPPVLTRDEAVEVIRSVWLGTDLARPQLAFAVILYSERLLNRRSDIRLLLAGCAAVLVAVIGPRPVPQPTRTWVTALILVFAAAGFAYAVAIHKARRRHGEARRRADEMVRNA